MTEPDELTVKRQQKCADRPQGHTFTQGDFGICSNCLLRVESPEYWRNNPPEQKNGKE